MSRSTLIMRAFGLAFLLLIVTLMVQEPLRNHLLTLDTTYARNAYSATKAKSHDAIIQSTSEDSILLLGSSELNESRKRAEHPLHSLNYRNINVNLVGKAGYQSLSDAILAGSVYDELSPSKPLNLILSIQWFYKPGVSNNYFQYSFSLDHWYHFVNNEQITWEHKEAVRTRMLSLTSDDKVMQEQIDIVWQAAQGNPLCKVIEVPLLQGLCLKENINLLWEFFMHQDQPTQSLDAPIDWAGMRPQAITTSEKTCSNNPFGFEDSYFNRVIRGQYEQGGFDGYYNDTFIQGSPEFDDLKMFLDVTQDLGIDVNLYVIPLPTLWTEYAHFPQQEMDAYYGGIEEIAKRYPHVMVHTYKEQSGMRYFFQDKVHFGGLAWTYILPDLLNANGFGAYNSEESRTEDKPTKQ